MSEYIIQSETLTGIADAIRAKTGSSDPIQVSDMATQISSITGGGSADVRYVTFMNGSVELYKKPVAVGDDCVDVVSKGLIETPTKESTAQYSYTHYGWGASDGGAADSTILQNITEDKTVYAIFTAAVRYYTITYLDDDGTTVLKTETLAYGATPSYTPTKDGYILTGWTPEIASVTGDITYTAVWQEGYSFASTSWEKIAEISEAGEASKYFEVGDTRKEYIGTPTGDRDGYATFMIMGFDHDDLADGSGKAGMTIGMISNSSTYELVSESQTSNLTSWSFGARAYMKTVTKPILSSGEASTSDLIVFRFSLKELNQTLSTPSYATNWHNDGSSTYEAVTKGLYIFSTGAAPFWLRGYGFNSYYFCCGTTASAVSNASREYYNRYAFCI